MTLARTSGSLLLVAGFLLAGCNDSGVDDEVEAEIAYTGIDHGVDRAIDLGLKGYTQASSAHIPDQTQGGDVSGTMTVSGKVSHGSSDNHEMTLSVALSAYSDGVHFQDEDFEIYYDASAIALDMSLKGLPNADMTGSFNGEVMMTGDIEGPLRLSLSITGKTEEGPNMTIQKQAGTVHITGTAESENGVYYVDAVR